MQGVQPNQGNTGHVRTERTFSSVMRGIGGSLSGAFRRSPKQVSTPSKAHEYVFDPNNEHMYLIEAERRFRVRNGTTNVFEAAKVLDEGYQRFTEFWSRYDLCAEKELFLFEYAGRYVVGEEPQRDAVILATWDRLIADYPESPTGYVRKGSALVYFKKDAEAVEMFQKAVSVKGRGWDILFSPDYAYIAAANALVRLGRLEESIPMFEKSIPAHDISNKGDNGCADEPLKLAEVLVKLGRPQDAIEALDRISKVRPRAAERLQEKKRAILAEIATEGKT